VKCVLLLLQDLFCHETKIMNTHQAWKFFYLRRLRRRG